MILGRTLRVWTGRTEIRRRRSDGAHEQYDEEIVQAFLWATGQLDRTSAAIGPGELCKIAANPGNRRGGVLRALVCARPETSRAIRRRRRTYQTDERNQRSHGAVPPSEAVRAESASNGAAIRRSGHDGPRLRFRGRRVDLDPRTG